MWGVCIKGGGELKEPGRKGLRRSQENRKGDKIVTVSLCEKEKRTHPEFGKPNHLDQFI